MIAEPENNLFIVGDDDQSIYRFRALSRKLCWGLKEITPARGESSSMLITSCTEEIAGPAMRLIENNENASSKKIRTNGARGSRL